MNDLIVAEPDAGPPDELVLLFHGVGSTPQDMVPLARLLASARPRARVVCVRSADPSDFGSGWQWFSVRGIDEASRPARVAAALPRFASMVRRWQADSAVDADATTLVGFSQGSIMALEATQQAGPALAARIISIAGRFAEPPRLAPAGTTVHLLHGEDDEVIDPRHSIAAAERLRELGAAVELHLVPGIGHGIDARVARRVVAAWPA